MMQGRGHHLTLRRLLGRALAAGIVLSCAPAGAAQCMPASAGSGIPGWPAWEGFAKTFIADSGRLTDPSPASGQTTSEGQSYALFFSLVANDRTRFEQILRWSENNLAGGDLTARLPAWSWGRKADNSWGILDDNPAADADLWIAYTLQEAGRLWQRPKYTALGQNLAERILREETVVLDGIGRLLLPAPSGFQPTAGSARLNPSYMPLQLLRRLAAGSSSDESKAQWTQQVRSTTRMLIESAPRGFAPDWIGYTSARGFTPDPDSKAVGSFNAIRTYLWAGMLATDDPVRATLHKTFLPMVQLTARNGVPPQRVDTSTGSVEGSGDAGFSAALLPLISSISGATATQLQRGRIAAREPLARSDNYYEQVLTLFGLGWADGYYKFAGDGMLRLRPACNAN